MKNIIILLICLPVLSWAVEVTLTAEQLDEAVRVYDKSVTTGRANLTFEAVLKKKNIILPECESFFVEQSIATCKNYKCMKKVVFSNLSMVEEIIIKPKSENPNVCQVLTPERGYTIEKVNWALFGKMYDSEFHVSQDESYKLHAEVAGSGYTDRKTDYDYKNKTCSYRIRYKFKLDKYNTVAESFKQTKNGLSEGLNETTGKAYVIYTENGKSYKAADPAKPVMFHATVESFSPDKKNDVLCSELNPVLPTTLEKAGMLEFFKPIN